MSKILKKHRALIQSTNIFNPQQIKAYNGLLYFAKEQLSKNVRRKIFRISSLELRKLISKEVQIKEDELKLKLKELLETSIEFNIFSNQRFVSWKAMVLLSEVELFPDGILEYSLPETIRLNLIKPDIFCPLDLEIINRFKSKFSIIIYEFCKDYIKVEIPKIPIEKFKKLLGIDEKYKRMYDLKLNVLDVAKKEIDSVSDIEIDYETIKIGNKVTDIKFKAKYKNNNKTYSAFNNQKVSKKILIEISSLISQNEILTDKEIQELKELTEKYGKEIVTSNIKYTNRQNYQNYFVYLKKAILEDYGEKDRKIEEMKEEERKKYEEQVKQEEAEAKEREKMRNQAKNYYLILSSEEKEEIEEEATKELEKVEGIVVIKKSGIIYDNMKLNKIIEIVQKKYL